MKSREKTQIIKDYLFLNELTEKEFCKKLNVPYKSLRKVLTGKPDRKFNRIFNIAHFLSNKIKPQ